ncbi:MAG: anhydro-N-acetylmuramic acid kinase [Rubrivivax sp.]
MALFIGLMSGTSVDGVDGVLADFGDDGMRPVQTLAVGHRPMPTALAQELLALNQSGPDELHRAARATTALMRLYADVVQVLLLDSGIDAAAVAAIGAHGQTVRHRPQPVDGAGYTLQLANGALLAEWTGIAVVCDLRSADVAAGGQGAPLVPAFHAACWGGSGDDRAVLNVGGIANLTLLHADGTVGGFDTGPGNLLMDLWAARTFGCAYDADGAIADRGQVRAALLSDLLQAPYFSTPPPKSTGRDDFHAAWLDAQLAHHPGVAAADVMSTLCELTARSAADALRRALPGARRLRVCGGGAFNRSLMRRLAGQLTAVDVQSTSADGVSPEQVEALAFAWLAAQRLAGRPGNVPGVTGARGARVLGALHAPPR